MGPCIIRIFQYISNNMQCYTVYYIWKLLYMFQVVPPPIIRSAYNCIHSISYLSHRYCYLPLFWKSSNSSTIAAGSSNGVTNTRCCRYSCMRSWWWVELAPDTCRAVSRYNKLCNIASCWIYIGIWVYLCYPSLLNQIFHKSSINHSTLCLRKTTQFPHSAQNLATTIAGQQQALHLLLVKTTHSLSTILSEAEDRWSEEGEGLAPKKDRIMGI